MEELFNSRKIISVDNFRANCPFFDNLIKIEPIINLQQLCPFENKTIYDKLGNKYIKTFWKNFYSKNLDYICSYWFRNYNILITENTNGNIPLITEKINILKKSYDDFEFHMICKLKNNYWLYVYISSYISFNFNFCPDFTRNYISNDIDKLVKYGVAIKDYYKIGIVIKTNEWSVIQNTTCDKYYNEDYCPICIEEKEEKIFLDCGHFLCKGCIGIKKININIKCPKCSKYTILSTTPVNPTYVNYK